MGDTPHGKGRVGCHVGSPSGKRGFGTMVCGKCRRSQELVGILQGGAAKEETLQNLSELALLRDGSHAETRPEGNDSRGLRIQQHWYQRRFALNPECSRVVMSC